MADDKPADPSAQFQEYVTQWERSVDQFFNQLMGNEQFSQSMNQMQGLQIEFQKNFRDSMANQLTSMNMPSRDDVLQIGEDIRVLDARLGRMEDKLNQLIEKLIHGTFPLGHILLDLVRRIGRFIICHY